MNGYVGRVNLSAGSLGAETNPDSVPGFGYERTVETKFTNDMLRGNWEHSSLSDAFFSKNNMDAIQASIRKEVFNKSQPKGYIIDDQSVDELKIIMRAIYYQYSRNLPNDIAGQVKELNDRILAWSVPHILSAVDHYVYYIKDIDTLPVPMALPVNLTRAGSKSLPFNSFM
jgi:hypothetical protein